MIENIRRSAQSPFLGAPDLLLTHDLVTWFWYPLVLFDLIFLSFNPKLVHGHDFTIVCIHISIPRQASFADELWLGSICGGLGRHIR